MSSPMPRTDFHTAAIVDHGIALAEQYGISEGYVYMRDNNVPLMVMLRVLSSPEQRRKRE